jgi:hypothetical protein
MDLSSGKGITSSYLFWLSMEDTKQQPFSDPEGDIGGIAASPDKIR